MDVFVGSRLRIVVTAISLAFLAIASARAHRSLLVVDEPISLAVRGAGPASAFRAATTLGGTAFVLGMVAVVAGFVWSRCRPTAMVYVAAILTGAAVSDGLKALIDRPRPTGAVAGTALTSFPSGHTVMVTLLMGILPLAVHVTTGRRKLVKAAVGFGTAAIAAVGVSRVYLGAHWPTDVVGGVVVGAILVAAAEIALARWIPHRRCACALA